MSAIPPFIMHTFLNPLPFIHSLINMLLRFLPLSAIISHPLLFTLLNKTQSTAAENHIKTLVTVVLNLIEFNTVNKT